MSFKKLDFQSEFFDLYKLSEGAYGAISKENSDMGSNAGFIDLGDFTVIVDTTLSMGAIKDLNKAAIKYSGKKPQIVIITHFHLDHIIGNSLLDPSTLIISSDRTQENIKIESQNRIDELKNMTQKEINKMEENLKTEQNEEKKQEIMSDLKFIKNIRAKDFSLRIPNITFKDELIIYGEKRDVHLNTFKKAHTDGDVIVYVPHERILYAGDLLFSKCDPWLGSGDPDGWKSVIDKILELDFKIVVPGHGDLASKEEFSLQKKYITEIVDLVKKQIKSEKDPIILKRDDFSPEFQKWKGSILEWNVNFLVDFLKKS
jgi:cyclase